MRAHPQAWAGHRSALILIRCALGTWGLNGACKVYVSWDQHSLERLCDWRLERKLLLSKGWSGDTSSLRIAGFGACMVSGYPYESGGLFEVACASVEKKLSRPVETSVLTLHGFPAPRAEKYLKSKIVPFNPDYIVIQFGSTDAARPIRKRPSPAVSASEERPAFSTPTSCTNAPAFRSSTPFTIVRWHAQSLVGFFWKTAAITSLSTYVAAIEHMVSDCIIGQNHACCIVSIHIWIIPFSQKRYHLYKRPAGLTYEIELHDIHRLHSSPLESSQVKGFAE